ncbi:MEIOTIC F-BOX protein MOF [Brachypodium distachyon]|uniref:F-box domain-containing protein n=1 Tax=Brachypodium distachyon TaxID=15368 RepID=A0A0Q3I9H6_BRADI|nr:MEIOTIC F-BOX protein MOF [Brachypodium distachyon]KQJ82768.1 hypothetical protein BRADI_5g10896v3 [Brachypodium distachyon]|eukprot:XP_010239941.1 MEIOTIC F-BOX protein MOF [Brachypodium distachyon]
MAEHSRKRARSRSRGRASPGSGSGRDRLSDLPDALLHSIMSHLGARQAVQTSAASRRWRHLWRSMPRIRIDFRDFAPPTTTTSAPAWCNAAWRKLELFADSLLDLHSAAPGALDEFRLHADDLRLRPSSTKPRSHQAYLDMWVRRGVTECGRRPAALDVVAGNTLDGIPFPRRLGSSPDNFCRLTTMRLRGLYLARTFGEDLRSGCPVLEQLTLEVCSCYFPELVSGSLKTLSLVSCHPNPRSITAPALARLCVSSPCPVDRPELWDPKGTARSVARASIPKLSCSFDQCLFDLLASACNVRALKLSGFSPPVRRRRTAQLDDEPEEFFPVLPNLTTLFVEDSDMCMRFEILGLFLQNAPNLQTVTLRHCKDSDTLPDDKNGREWEGSLGRRRRNGWKKTPPPPTEKPMDIVTWGISQIIRLSFGDGQISKLLRTLLGISTVMDTRTIILTKENEDQLKTVEPC